MLPVKKTIPVLIAVSMIAGVAMATGDPARGKELALDCADCHGEDGMGDHDIPRISGLDEAYIIEQLKAFKSGERISRDDMMLLYVEDIDENDMADLAAYWSMKHRE